MLGVTSIKMVFPNTISDITQSTTAHERRLIERLLTKIIWRIIWSNFIEKYLTLPVRLPSQILGRVKNFKFLSGSGPMAISERFLFKGQVVRQFSLRNLQDLLSQWENFVILNLATVFDT
ncbi:hypothetical protein WJ73_28920 [Burkholderia ubonensis]|nr:hypothetical protein WJ73_28920 [Burkholderia ubonensis]